MKKYTKGFIRSPQFPFTNVWEACIDFNKNSAEEWLNKIVIYEQSEKKVKRLRKKIMKALNKSDDKKDVMRAPTNYIDEINALSQEAFEIVSGEALKEAFEEVNKK